MDAKKCDRCGLFYLMSDDSFKRACFAGGRMYGVRTIDCDWNKLTTYELCADCSNEFINWIKGGKKINEKK